MFYSKRFTWPFIIWKFWLKSKNSIIHKYVSILHLFPKYLPSQKSLISEEWNIFSPHLSYIHNSKFLIFSPLISNSSFKPSSFGVKEFGVKIDPLIFTSTVSEFSHPAESMAWRIYWVVSEGFIEGFKHVEQESHELDSH